MIIHTTQQREIIDITDKIPVPAGQGTITIFCQHTTCALIINEYETNLAQDLLEAYKTLTKQHGWKHDTIDNNAQAHIIASLLNPSVTIPYNNDQLELGTWQRVLLVELDGPKKRTLITQATPSNIP